MAKIFKNVWFRCIFTLLVIAVISGGLLAVLNDVLYVSAAERTERAIAKIYGEKKSVSDDDILIDADSSDESKNKPVEYEFGSVNKLYRIGDDLLFQTTGYKGYKNGTVTLWVLVSENDGVYSITKVVLESYEKQTLMSKFGTEYYDGFKLEDVTANYKEGEGYFSANASTGNQPNTGATYTAAAHCNAVNCVVKYLGELTK